MGVAAIVMCKEKSLGVCKSHSVNCGKSGKHRLSTGIGVATLHNIAFTSLV